MNAAEVLIGIADVLPIEAFIEEEQSPVALPFPLNTRYDYTTNDGYRITWTNGYAILTVNGTAAAAGQDAIELADELGPWKAIPRYYYFQRESREQYADRQLIEYYDRLEKIVSFAAWCREEPVAALGQLTRWNLAHPEKRMSIEWIKKAEKIATARLYQSDEEPTGETATGRNRPTVLAE